jgi:hypothetical protein
MKAFVCALALTVLGIAGAARAEPYKDYTFQKGAWQITEVHVDPNHLDDYLTGLKEEWVPGQEIAKKHGVIDDYSVMVRIDPSGTGANVLLGSHYPSLSQLEPNQVRDSAMEQESYAAMSKDKSAAVVAGFEKYRTFVGDGFYETVDLAK